MTTPLTEAEHARMRDLIGMGYWTRISATDERLIALGLVRRNTSDWTVEANMEQVGPEGFEPYYEKDGSVSEFRYPDAATFVPRMLG